jgi:hypothetical protein
VVAAAVDGDASVPGSSVDASVGAPVATASVWLSPPATTTTTIPITAIAATAAAINSQVFPVWVILMASAPWLLVVANPKLALSRNRPHRMIAVFVGESST